MNKDDVDFVARDKRKYGEGSGFLLGSTAACLASVLVATPIALVGGLVSVPQRLLMPAESKTIGSKLVFPPVGPTLVEVKPMAEREFDIVMYGATGFTGGLAAKYLAKQYGKKLKWALAGRRMEALEKLRTECIALNPSELDSSNVSLIQVDSANDEQLQSMCARTRVVISTVGPFVNYGTPLVRAAIATKSRLCDITGEVAWNQGCIDMYDSEARKQGAMIVSFCGNDSVPWDLTTFMCAKKLKEDQAEDLRAIEMIDALVGKPSGGTLESALEHSPMPYKTVNGDFDPLLRTDAGQKSEFKMKNTSKLRPVFTSTKQWAGPFIMSMVNAQVVKRSNALNGYGRDVSYEEHRAADSYSSVIGRYLQMIAIGPILILPRPLRNTILPAPGQGPTETEMDESFLHVTAVATGTKGSRVGARIYFNQDSGYRETARMLTETGLSIALSPERCTRQAGFVTPGACCAEVLLERLLATGTEFCFVSNL